MNFVQRQAARARLAAESLKPAQTFHHELRTGARNGVKFTPVHKTEPQVAPLVLPDEQKQVLATRSVPTDQRRGSVESLPLRKRASELFDIAHTQNLDIAKVRQGAGALLMRNTKAWQKWSGTASPKMKLMARRMALAATEDDVSDDDMTALATPMDTQERDPRDPHSGKDLAELLRRLSFAALQDDVKEGAEKDQFEKFLDNVLAEVYVDDKELADRAKLISELRDAHKHDDETIMRTLRKLQGIDELHEDGHKKTREALRQKLLNDLGEQVHDGREGTDAATKFNVAPAAKGMPDPQLFMDTLAEVVTKEVSVHQFSDTILNAYSIALLKQGGYLNRISQAVGEEIAAATSMRNVQWLYEAVTDRGHLSILSTLIDSALVLKDQMERLGDGQYA